jgi:hypothetical protein
MMATSRTRLTVLVGLIAALVTLVVVINIPSLSNWILLLLIVLGIGLTVSTQLLANRIAARRRPVACSYCLCAIDADEKKSSSPEFPVHPECRSLFQAARSA